MPRMNEAGAVEARWAITLLVVCLLALGAGVLFGFWLGS